MNQQQIFGQFINTIIAEIDKCIKINKFIQYQHYKLDVNNITIKSDVFNKKIISLDISSIKINISDIKHGENIKLISFVCKMIKMM